MIYVLYKTRATFSGNGLCWGMLVPRSLGSLCRLCTYLAARRSLIATIVVKPSLGANNICNGLIFNHFHNLTSYIFHLVRFRVEITQAIDWDEGTWPLEPLIVVVLIWMEAVWRWKSNESAAVLHVFTLFFGGVDYMLGIDTVSSRENNPWSKTFKFEFVYFMIQRFNSSINSIQLDRLMTFLTLFANEFLS